MKENIPEGWERVKLKEVLTEVSERNKGEKVKRVLSVTNSKGFMDQEEYFEGTVHSSNISNYKIVRKNQFAYNPSRVNVGSIDILKDYEEGALSPMYVIFKVDETRLLPEYFKYYFQTHRFYENVKNNTQGSVRNSLSFQALANFEYLLPLIEEQKEIINIFQNIDNIINKNEKIINRINDYKKAIVEKILCKGIKKEELIESKLGLIPKSWKIIKLKDCSNNIQYGLNASSEEYNEKKPKYLRITDIDEYGNYSKENKVSPKSKEYKKFIAKYGDILFARTGGTVGKNYLYDKKDGELVYAGYLICFSLKKDIVNPEFIKILVNTKRYWNWVKVMSMRSGQPGINSKEYGEYLLKIPEMEEQNKIVNIIGNIEKIENKSRKNLEHYIKLKKGLMQQLLTGKVRVKI